MEITREFISAAAPNAGALSNGKALVGALSELIINQDFIGGKCLGSGSKPYVCSVDFCDGTPVYRCSCPSRQIPCKHVLALMLAFVDGKTFKQSEIPADILEKREKKEKRVKAKSEDAEQSSSAAKSAAWKRSAVKKIDAQLRALEDAEKLLQNITQTGISVADAQTCAAYSQVVKKLDGTFISNIQGELYDLIGLLASLKKEAAYSKIVEKICGIQALIVRAAEYLTQKREQPDVLDVESDIEEQIGYAWKLDELRERGMFENDADVVQLCFHVRDDEDKKQFVDEGFFISLNSGKVFKALNYRPYKAAKHIKEEDSVFAVMRVPTLYVYPSKTMNPRVRWDSCLFRPIDDNTMSRVISLAKKDFAAVVKDVKNQLKNLSLERNPAVLTAFSELKQIDKDNYVIFDTSGNALKLSRNGCFDTDFISLLGKLDKKDAQNGALLLMFDNNISTGELSAQPMALVTDTKIVRLIF